MKKCIGSIGKWMRPTLKKQPGIWLMVAGLLVSVGAKLFVFYFPSEDDVVAIAEKVQHEAIFRSGIVIFVAGFFLGVILFVKRHYSNYVSNSWARDVEGEFREGLF